MKTKIHVSHVILYILYLFQTVATLVCLFSSSTLLFLCPSLILVVMVEYVTFATYLLLALWILLRLMPPVLGIIGFRHSLPRKLALILATVFTVLELMISLLFRANVAPLLLMPGMLIICIKGFVDLKNEWKDSYRRLCAERSDAAKREINDHMESPHDKLNTNPDPKGGNG